MRGRGHPRSSRLRLGIGSPSGDDCHSRCDFRGDDDGGGPDPGDLTRDQSATAGSVPRDRGAPAAGRRAVGRAGVVVAPVAHVLCAVLVADAAVVVGDHDCGGD